MCWEWQHFDQRHVIKWIHEDAELVNDLLSFGVGGDWGMVGRKFCTEYLVFLLHLGSHKNFCVFKKI